MVLSSTAHAGPNRAGPVVHVGPPVLELREIHFANGAAGTDFEYLYRNSNTHAIAPGDLRWMARGAKITAPEWVAGRADNFPACFNRNRPVALRAKLVWGGSGAISGRLVGVPALDGATSHISRAEIPFAFAAGQSETWVTVPFPGNMPDEVGRYRLDIAWTANGSGFVFRELRSTHMIFAAYGQPLDPEYDSPNRADVGRPTSHSDGTLTGTPNRMNQLTSLLGRTRRQPMATPADVIEFYWKLHVGINNTPGSPPYFDAGHDMHMSADGTSGGRPIDVRDQWLAWVRTPAPHWNDASCIGHVQVLKTMAAALGLFARRTWVFPATTRMPDGSTVAVSESDLFCLGTYDTSRVQQWTFRHAGRSFLASPKLMEPGCAWENFEACLLTPNYRFLTGGYSTNSNPASFRANKGFRSASELLRWWSQTNRAGFGRRFMCWVYNNSTTGEFHCWDVDGRRYTSTDYVEIRRTNKQLPPP